MVDRTRDGSNALQWAAAMDDDTPDCLCSRGDHTCQDDEPPPDCTTTGDTRTVCDCNCGEPRYEHGTCDYGPWQFTPCVVGVEAERRRTWSAGVAWWAVAR